MSVETLRFRAKRVSILVERGDSWSAKVTMPWPLTGYTVKAQLRDEPDSTKYVDLDVIVPDPDGQVFFFGQDAASKSGVYDVQLTSSGGLPRTYIKGPLHVSEDVTR